MVEPPQFVGRKREFAFFAAVPTVVDTVRQIILSVAGLIPGKPPAVTSHILRLADSSISGYWVSFLFIDSWGRKPIQLMGFIMLTITVSSCLELIHRRAEPSFGTALLHGIRVPQVAGKERRCLCLPVLLDGEFRPCI